MPLTDTSVRNAKPKGKPYKLSDERGMFLLVNPNGSKYWRLKYRVDGKEKLLALGVYPEISLKAARGRRDEARALLISGIDPLAQRKQEAVATTEDGETFEKVARAWWAQWKSARTEKHVSVTIRRLESDVFPAIGHVSVKKLAAPALIAMVKKIEARDALDLAKRSLQTCNQIMRYALAHGLTERNPAADIRPGDILTPRKKQNLARIDAKELPELMRNINAYDGEITTKLALNLMALTFLRTSELIGGRWEEIDVESRQWRVPASRMKMRTEHIVPLSKEALAVLEKMRVITGGSDFLFPGEKAGKTISNNTILYALYRMGYHSRMTGHGFRGLASTVLHENGFPHEHIEAQLAHSERDEVSSAYNHASYLKQRGEMMNWWGRYVHRAATLQAVTPMRKRA